MEKLGTLIDSHALGRLPEADRAKYQEQDDGTYKLVGDPTPSGSGSGDALPLYVSLDDLSKMPDALRGYYTDDWQDTNGRPADGRWKLRGYDDTTALKNAVGHVRAERDMIRDKLKKFDGFDPEEYKRLQTLKSQLEREKDLQRSEFDKQFTEAAEQYKSEIKVREERIQRLQNTLNDALIDRQAAIDISAVGGSPDLLLPHIRGRAKVQEVDGHYIAVILGEDGKPRLKKGAQQATDYMPIGEYVEELKDDQRFAGAFKGTGSSGSGATTGRDVDHSGAPATVSKHDMKAIGKYADSIAAGKTRVV